MIFSDRGRKTFKICYQLSSLGMFLGEVVKRIAQRHSVPADSAGPEIRRQACLRVGPTLLLRFIPAVIQQTGSGVARVRLHPGELLRDVVESSVVMKDSCVLCIERLAHIEAVEPHLKWINFLMPE